MVFLLNFVHILIYFLGIIFSCYLFTNAMEYLGAKLKLGTSATGAILAVVGTTLPETIIPLVAIISSLIFDYDIKISQNLAQGAILGSPFMLSTLALFLLVFVLTYQKRLNLNIDYKNTIRDYKYFICAYVLAIVSAYFIQIKYLAVFILISLYVIYAYRTIIKSKSSVDIVADELIFNKIFKKQNVLIIFIQIFISIFGLILFSHLFLDSIVFFSKILNINPLILSLVVTPFATELPECVNSILWTFNKKDELAISNILGAIVFQATILFSIGIILTPWNFDKVLLINSIIVVCVSFFAILSAVCKKTIDVISLLICGLFYLGYLAYLILFR